MNQGNKIKPFGVGRGLANLFSLSAHNVLVRACNAFLNLQVVEGETPSFVVSDNNAVLTLRKNPSSGATGIALRCTVTDASDDEELICEILDGSDAGLEITALRPTLLRASITSEDHDGHTVSYTYTGTQQRDASASGYVTHTQKILPQYTDNETVIYVMATANGGYVDMNIDARAWQAVPYIPVP